MKLKFYLVWVFFRTVGCLVIVPFVAWRFLGLTEWSQWLVLLFSLCSGGVGIMGFRWMDYSLKQLAKRERGVSS
jgi:hypothetical protein